MRKSYGNNSLQTELLSQVNFTSPQKNKKKIDSEDSNDGDSNK